MCQVLAHCRFSGVSLDGNCAYVHWGFFTSNSDQGIGQTSHLRGYLSPTSVYSTWQSPGGHPSNYEPGATLLNFSDRANHDERTPYSVYKWSCLIILEFCTKAISTSVKWLSRNATSWYFSGSAEKSYWNSGVFLKRSYANIFVL